MKECLFDEGDGQHFWFVLLSASTSSIHPSSEKTLCFSPSSLFTLISSKYHNGAARGETLANIHQTHRFEEKKSFVQVNAVQLELECQKSSIVSSTTVGSIQNSLLDLHLDRLSLHLWDLFDAVVVPSTERRVLRNK